MIQVPYYWQLPLSQRKPKPAPLPHFALDIKAAAVFFEKFAANHHPQPCPLFGGRLGTGLGAVNPEEVLQLFAGHANAGAGSPFEISTALSATTVAAGKTLTVSVRPKTGLAAKAYTDQLKITGSNGISLTVSLNFTVSAAATYIASVDLASKTFTAANTGYGTQPAQVFTIKNDGTGTINTLAAALKTGTAFEISAALSGTTVAATKTQTVSVRPKTGLGAGTYTDQLNITGSNGIAVSATLKFTVSAQQFTLTNTGTGTLTGLSAALSPNSLFEISTALSGTAVDASKTLTISVRPKTGLSARTCTDQLKITGNNGINISVPLSFTVMAKTVSVDAQVGTPVWGTAGTATFNVTTVNIDNGKTGEVAWFSNAAGTTPSGSNPTGIFASVSAVSSNKATVTVNTTTAAVGNTYYFKVTMDGKASNVQSLVINYFAGEGTDASPYLIGVAGQLAKMGELVNANDMTYTTASYKLTANINLGIDPYNKGTGWTHIGKGGNGFEGSFDGNGKTISGLFINNSALENAGLFGQSTGVIKNIGIENVTITNNGSGNNYAGGVAGSSMNDVISGWK